MNITHKFLQSISGKPYDGKHELKDDNGLYLRVSPKGLVSFQCRYKLAGKPIRYKIGTFPSMSLKDARAQAEEDQSWVRRGSDPRTRGILESTREQFTLKRCIDFWFRNYASVNRSDPDKILNQLLSLIPKKWLLVNVEHMTSIDWSNLYKDIAKGNSSGFGLNCIIELRTLMRFCISEGRVSRAEFEPLRPGNFCKHYEERERVLTPAEISLILNHLPMSSLGERNQIVFLMILVFGPRENELCLAEEKHFNFTDMIWTVPKENLKGGRSRRKVIKRDLKRPIPPLMVPYIKRLIALSAGSRYILKNRGSSDKPVPPSSLAKIAETLRDELDMDHWVMHDLRTTISTLLTDLGCPIYVPDKLIGHVMKGSMRKYNQSDMLFELNHWLNIWCDKLMQWKVKPESMIELTESAA